MIGAVSWLTVMIVVIAFALGYFFLGALLSLDNPSERFVRIFTVIWFAVMLALLAVMISGVWK